jgi:N-methylhydantoinase A
VLGYLETPLAGGLALDVEAAQRALATLGKAAGLDATEAAEGVVRVTEHEMLSALRVVTVERGVDPRRFSLVAFGGAGPMHAARIAAQLGVQRVLCPGPAGVLSALGLVTSDRRTDDARSLFLTGADLTAARMAEEVDRLTRTALEGIPGGRIEVTCDLRYRGQAFELQVEASNRPDPQQLRKRFEEAHRQRYGYSDPTAEVELVNLRVAAIAEGGKPELRAAREIAESPRSRLTRKARFGSRWLDTAVWRGELPGGTELEGPAVCELPESTVVVPPGWIGQVRPEGTLVLELR